MAKSAILSVRIVGNARDAKRSISDTERSLDRLNKSAAASGVKMSRMYSQLDKAADAAFKVGAVTTALQATTVAAVRTGKALAPLAGLLAVVPGAAAAGGAALATFKTATKGFGAAVAAAGEGTEQFNEATKNMAPAMASAARATGDVVKSFENVRRTVQASFWAGIDAQVRSLGSAAMPVLSSGMNGVATAGNKVFTELLKVAGTQPVMDALSAAFAAAQRSMEGLAPAVGPFVSGIAQIVKASSGLIDGFSGAEDAAKKFNEWATRISNNGQLAKWFEEGKTAAKQLGSILGSAGRALGAVADAAMAAAGDGGGLGRVADTMRRIADVVSTPEMQEQMTESFERANEVAGAFSDVLIAVLPTIARFGPELILMGTAWKTASVATAVYRGAVDLVSIAQAIFGSKAVVSLAKTAAQWMKTAATALIAGAKMAAAWLLGLGPIGLVVAAIAGIVAAFIIAYNKCGWFKDGVDTAMAAVKQFVSDAVEKIKKFFTDAWNIAKDKVNGFKSAVSDSMNKVKTIVSDAANIVKDKWKSSVDAVKGFFGGLWSKASDVGSRIKSVLSGAASGMTEAFKKALGGVKRVLDSIVDAARGMRDKVKGIIDGIKSAASSVASSFSFGFFSDGGFQLRPAVASNLPDPGKPFMMEAAGQVLSPTRWGSSGGRVETHVTNITIEGALDPVAVGRQIEKLVKDSRIRYGTSMRGDFL